MDFMRAQTLTLLAVLSLLIGLFLGYSFTGASFLVKKSKRDRGLKNLDINPYPGETPMKYC